MTTIFSIIIIIILGLISFQETVNPPHNFFETPTTTGTPTPTLKLKPSETNTSSPSTNTALKSTPKVETPIAPRKSTPTSSVTTPTEKPSIPTSINSTSIIDLTNKERHDNNIPNLKSNPSLTKIAGDRLKDMQEKNYFAHVSPDGNSVVELSSKYGYEYSIIGENIARGDFRTSKDVVNGWMNSPGHRANILNNEYKEIGVAAEFVQFGGRNQWLIVQVFGRQF